MGFNERAGRVRYRPLAHGKRVAALCSCVRLFHPIGHRATLNFLAEVAGPYQRNEAALLRALEVLEASRAAWHAEDDAYQTQRKRQKRLNQAKPPNDPPLNRMSGHWYSADPKVSRRAALVALKLWEQDHEQAFADDEVRSLVRSCIATGGRLTGEQLDTVLSRTRDEAEAVRWPMTLVASASGVYRPR